MAELAAREAKLVQYLNEAYGKERELETALQAHIAMTTRAPYKRRLQDHLRETKGHSRGLQRRIRELGGKAEVVSAPGPDAVGGAASAVVTGASKAVAAAKGPLHALRGTGEQEKMLKNAKTEYWNEAEEIATYRSIETLADTVGDRQTVNLVRGIRREEERMSKFLERLIPTLTKAVAQEEIPASERNGGRRRRSTRRRRSGSSSRGRASSSRSRSSSSSRSRSSSGRSASGGRTGSTRARSSSSRSGRASSSRGRSTSARGRSTSARSGRASSSRGRAASSRGRSSSSGGRSTSARGRSTSARGRSSSSRGRSTSSRGRSGSSRGRSSGGRSTRGRS